MHGYNDSDFSCTRAFKKVNIMMMETHMKSCVKEAMETNEGDKKIDEVLTMLSKYYKG